MVGLLIYVSLHSKIDVFPVYTSIFANPTYTILLFFCFVAVVVAKYFEVVIDSITFIHMHVVLFVICVESGEKYVPGE